MSAPTTARPRADEVETTADQTTETTTERTDEEKPKKPSRPSAVRRLLQKMGVVSKGPQLDEDGNPVVEDTRTLADFPHLMALKPREKMVFRSDYFTIDDEYACILAFFHKESAQDSFGVFWGVNRIPRDLGDNVTTVVIEKVRRKGEGWIKAKRKTAEQVNSLDEREQGKGSTSQSRQRTAKALDDTEIITAELNNGASYLHVHDRLFVKAGSLESLDEAIDAISRLYIDRFKTLSVSAYPGEQRQELTGLMMSTESSRGKGFHFTSTEFAGSHGLITNGLSDPAGEYVGFMTGDVNNSAVLFDVNSYKHHVVIADDRQNTDLGRIFYSDLWASRISQAALTENGSVVHLVLNGAELDKMGPRFPELTSRIDMNSGDVNMFEMFGDREDELSIFPAHLNKIVLMARQLNEAEGIDRSIMDNELKKVLTRYYIDSRMWYENAKSNRDRLRVVGIAHKDVPKLEMFVAYLDTAYEAVKNAPKNDQKTLNAYNVLRGLFEDMLNSNGDLFNSTTKDSIDTVRDDRRVIYDFSRLLVRGKAVAMAQLVNIIGFAVSNLGEGDTVVVHGAEFIEPSIKTFVFEQFETLYRRGGRVAFVYNDIEKMIDDHSFNRIDKADYSILGTMTENTVKTYQSTIGQTIPDDLTKLVTTRDARHMYLRRGVTNVVFYPDLTLGIKADQHSQSGSNDLPPGMTEMGSQAETDRESSISKEAVLDKVEKKVARNGAQARLRRELSEDRSDSRERLTEAPSRRLERHRREERETTATKKTLGSGPRR